MVAILSSNRISMSDIDIKPRFGGNGSKSRFTGGAAITYGGGQKIQNQTNEKGPTPGPGLEDVFMLLTNLTQK